MEQVKTVCDRFVEKAEELSIDLEKMKAISGLIARQEVPGRRLGEMCFGVEYLWQELGFLEKEDQKKLLEKYWKFISELKFFLSPKMLEKDLDQYTDLMHDMVLSLIRQEDGFYKKPDINELFELALQTIRQMKEIVRIYYPDGVKEIILLPDTNCLFLAPAIENWEFNEIKEYTLLFSPTVLSEIDSKKVSGNERVKASAKTLSRQFKEYNRRGNTLEGIRLKPGVTLKMRALEPKFEEMFSALDSTNNDDRIIMTCFGVMRENPQAEVYLVTADINMQNKARFWEIALLEAPEKEE